MNFRKLTTEELLPLTKEFTMYLAANGIDASEWQKLKDKDIQTTDHHIKAFSGMVWLRIFSSKKYMSFRNDNVITHFDFQTDKYVQIQVLSAEDGSYNLGYKEEMYVLSREEDMFQWSALGAIFEDGQLFKQLLMEWIEAKESN